MHSWICSENILWCFTQLFSSLTEHTISGELDANLEAYNEEDMCVAGFGKGTQGPDSID